MRTILFVLLFFALIPVSYSASMQASELLSHCQARPDENKPIEHNLKQAMRFSFCGGYISGIIDGYVITRRMGQEFCKCEKNCFFYKTCLPKQGVQVGEVLDAMIRYSKKDPSIKNQTARAMVLETIHKMYPCGKK